MENGQNKTHKTNSKGILFFCFSVTILLRAPDPYVSKFTFVDLVQLRHYLLTARFSCGPWSWMLLTNSCPFSANRKLHLCLKTNKKEGETLSLRGKRTSQSRSLADRRRGKTGSDCQCVVRFVRHFFTYF